jgi:LmbE family N-acetylglucosaminyl deacetylase
VTILALSAHLGDAVLSAGAWLSWHRDVIVCTVFAGDPHDSPLTPADREQGFADARKAMTARRAEDTRAVAAVGGIAQHLPLLDATYRGAHSYSHNLLVNVLVEVADELAPSLIVAPLGIVHPDSIALGSAAWHAFKGRDGCPLVFYEDVPARIDDPAAAVFEVASKGLQWYAPETCPDDEAALQAKIAGIKCYRSSLWAIPSVCYFVPERLHLCP